ncbi:GNAT family N-acetyltransferase [Crenothrix sp.]|uniref:GNAT family N-acetyltransferase n=1 Tax=Crenothrix sp. TaxID=3100433 RepID=UPI00374DEA12
MWLPIYRIEKDGLTVVLIGRKSQDPYFVQLLYGDYADSQKVGSVFIWNINKTIQHWEKHADMILFRDHGVQPSGTIARRMFNIPYYVSQTAKLPPVDGDLLAAFRDPSTVSDINKIRKAGFEYHISNDPAQLEYFYHCMYKPFILSRHRDSARIPSWPSFKRIHENMELLLITRAGELVAGAMNFQNDDCYTGYANGVLNADRKLIKDGVVSAIYWFGMIDAHRRGYRTVNLGTSRPFLKNGVLAYKKKWGSQIIIDENEVEFKLLACGNQLAAQRFFETTPFICKQDNTLVSLVFLGPHVELNDKDLSSYLRACLFQGDHYSTWIILLSAEWASRTETLQATVRGLAKSTRIINLSNGAWLDLPDLIRDFAATQASRQNIVLASPKQPATTFTRH